MEKLEMTIEGMHCSCFVDYNGKKGTWEIDPAKVTKEQIQKSIADLGYGAI